MRQILVKLIRNTLYDVQFRKDIDQFHDCKSDDWRQTEYDENVIEYWKIPKGIYIVEMKNDDGLNGDYRVKITLPSHLGAFILSNSERIINNFIREINGFHNKSIYYGDTGSLYLQKKN